MLKIIILSLVIVFMGFIPMFQKAYTQTINLSTEQQLARTIFKELVEINTTNSSGNTTIAANAIAKRLVVAGFDAKDIKVTGPQLRNRNLVVRLRGSGKKPAILFLAHLDVVEARREDWSFDPFKFLERDGYFYGRGTQDVKDGVAILVANFIKMKLENFKPDRDLILALTAGEEGGSDYNGLEWLLKYHRPLIDASFCINMELGDPQIKNGKRILRPIQASEKGYMKLSLEVKNRGGHSSLPVKDNAIYRLAEGLTKLARYEFPVQLNEVTRAYFEKMSLLEKGQMAADMKSVASNSTDSATLLRLSLSPYYNALMRTTCVATMLQAGHAENALPQLAKAILNCRVLPGHPIKEIEQTIINVLLDSQIVVSVMWGLDNNPASPLFPELMQKVEQVTEKCWPDVFGIPVMEVGATDGLLLRIAGIPTYGISGVFIDVDDNRIHGKDERIGVKEFYDGLEYIYQLIKSFSS